jgi:hypothetical protein
MIPRAMLAVAYATGRDSHAREVKGDNPDKKGYSGPSGLELGVRLTTAPRKKNIFLRNLKKMKLDGYLGNDMRQYIKVCG